MSVDERSFHVVPFAAETFGRLEMGGDDFVVELATNVEKERGKVIFATKGW